MSPFVGWQGIPLASLSQVRMASLKLLSATCPLCTSGTLLVCLVLDTFPSYLLLSDPTIGSVCHLCVTTLSLARTSMPVHAYTQRRNCGC